MTLEKVADKRDERMDSAKRGSPDPDPFRCMWDEFLTKGQVHVMHTKFDELIPRMITKHTLEPEHRNQRIFVDPPWRIHPTDDGGASE